MSIRLNSGTYIRIDLTTAFDVVPSTTAVTCIVWGKKIGAWVDYDPFIAIADNTADRTGSIETYNDNNGATRLFEGAWNASAIGLGAPNITTTGVWRAVGFTRNAGASINGASFHCGNETALTSHVNIAMTHSNAFRYITIGELAQVGLVSSFNGEVAHCRAWASQLDPTQLLAEFNSPTPVITANLLCSFSFDSTTDTVDQGPNGLTWTFAGGTISNGSSHPPPGPAAGGGIAFLPLFSQRENILLRR